MTIYRLLKESTFSSEDVKAMTLAYETALTILGITDRNCPASEAIARKIVDLGSQGEGNAVELCGQALREIEIH